jgi:Tfp pilus assembly PilM family ATPase
MGSSIYISSEQIEAIGYTKTGRNITVNEYETCYLPEGTMINGRILDSVSLTEALSSMYAKNPLLFKEASLIIDGSSVSTKKVVVPKMKKWQYYQLINDDFADSADNFKELLCDYQMLRTKDGTTAILSCASDKTQIESYIAAFKDAGIILKSIHIGVQALMNYVDSAPELQKGTIVINVIDGVTMLSVIFENGINVFMSRIRLYSDDKQQFASDIHNHLSGLIQFVKSEKLNDITRSYYLGLDRQDINLLQVISQHPTIEFLGLEIYGRSAQEKGLAPSAHFAYLNISLPADSIDLMRSLRTLEKFKKLSKPKRPEIIIFAAIVLLLGAAVGFLFMQTRSVQREIDGVNRELEAMAEKADELDRISDDTAFYLGLERQHELKTQIENSIAPISNEIIDVIFNTHSNRIAVSRIEFNEAGRTIRVAARSRHELGSVEYVEELTRSDLIETVLYTGYSYASDPEGLSYNFNIEIRLAAPEIIEAAGEESGEV